MEGKNTLLYIGIFAAFAVFLLFAGTYFFPWKDINWGKVELAPAQVVTVTGEAKTQERSQVASFTAGVNAVNDNKDTAIAEVNQKIDAIIQSLTTFGIPKEDVKTQNLNVYQTEETYYEEGRQKSRLGQWRVSNSIEVKLKDVNRASELANLLSGSGANNVYGPNFSVEDTTEVEKGLLEEAINDAKEKAEIIAKASNRQLGGIVTISEGYQPLSYIAPLGFEGGRGGGGADLQPGSATVAKTVTVTFSLK